MVGLLVRIVSTPLAVLVAALALAVGTGTEALADVASARRPVLVITPGPSLEMGLDGSLRFGGDLALTQYAGTWAMGGALGFVSGRLYLEAQPALVFGRQHNGVLGLNGGFVVDVTAAAPRYGAQTTIWANYARGASRPWASPLVPFVRAQAVLGMGVVFSGGIMLKLPVPVS